MTRLRDTVASAGQAGFGEARLGGSAESAGPVRHFVTDRRRFGLSVEDLVARAAQAVRVGVDVIQVRERDLPDRQLTALVRQIVAVAVGSATRVVVNDRADIAIVAGAAGAHLRADSAPASRIRAAIAAPARLLIGRSVHSIAEVEAAVADGGCDYLLFGTVFPSEGKPDGHPVAGIEGLALACARSPLPVIAIGGMTNARADAVRRAGAAGFAAVGMFMCLTPLSPVV